MLNSTRLTTAFAAAFLLAGCFSPGRTAAAGPLVAHWAFEEGRPDAPATGPILDSSGNGHDGVAVNGPVYRETPGGPSGLALDFNGIDQQVFIPDDPEFQVGNSFTVEAWFLLRSFPPAARGPVALVVRGDTRAGLNTFSVTIDEQSLVFNVADNQNNEAIASRFISTDSWFHVGVTFDNGRLTTYVRQSPSDPVVTNIEAINQLDPAFDPGIYIGGENGSFFDGLIDEVRVYNQSLFPNEHGFSVFGDVTNDGVVGLDDLNEVRNWFGCDCGGRPPGDADRDGLTNLTDLNIIRNEFGSQLEQYAHAPEPAGGALAMLAGVVLCLNRRMRSFARSPNGRFLPATCNAVRVEPARVRFRKFGFEGLEDRALLAIGSPILNFAGQQLEPNWYPPDTVGDVGKHHYVQMINDSDGSLFTVYNKENGTVALGPKFTDSLAPPGSACAEGAGDPIVLYDHLADRWLISEFAPRGVNTLCVYISQTDDPSDDLWYHYSFETQIFPDYPKYAVWPDAYYLSTNEGGAPPAYALDRENMLQGLPARPFQKFSANGLVGFITVQHFLPSDLDGAIPPPAGSPNYFIRHVDDEIHLAPEFIDPENDFLDLWEFRVDWDNPANSSFVQIPRSPETPGLPAIPIEDYDSLCTNATDCIPQPNTNTSLDSVSHFVMWRLQYRNFGTHETLLGNFTVDADGNGLAGIRWFELRKTGAGDWSLHQEGTHSPDSVSRWMGSIAMDGDGNVALGYNVSDGASVYPGIRYTGRNSSDPLGTMEEEYVLIDGSFYQSPNSRWGDYSAMSVDPVDDKTFWFTGEYKDVGAPKTRIGTFSFTEPGPRVTDVRIGSTLSVHADYQIPTGSGEQIRTVPVGQANQVEVVFSEDVNVSQGDLALVGAYSGNSYTNISGFNYDPGTFTATWTFTTAFPADQMVLTIADAVADAAGNALDGEWHNPDALVDTGTDVFPSGNGVAGVDFVFRFTILPGDVNRDNVVDIVDRNTVMNNFGMNPALWTDGDTDGTGAVDIGDWNNVANNFGKDFTVWPSGGQQAQSGGGTAAMSIDDAFLLDLAELYAVHRAEGTGNQLFWDALATDEFWKEILRGFTAE